MSTLTRHQRMKLKARKRAKNGEIQRVSPREARRDFHEQKSSRVVRHRHKQKLNRVGHGYRVWLTDDSHRRHGNKWRMGEKPGITRYTRASRPSLVSMVYAERTGTRTR